MTLLAPGPQPIYFRRGDRTDRVLLMTTHRSHGIDPGPSVRGWLLRMAQAEDGRLGPSLSRCELVQWRDAASYRDAVEGWRSEVTDAFLDLGRRLVIRGALTAAEAEQLQGRCQLEIDDQRLDSHEPLPELGPG